MQQKNSKNEKENHNSEILKKIESILGDISEYVGKEKSTSQVIDAILEDEKNKKHRELALYLVGFVDAKYYNQLDESLKQDKTVALTALGKSYRIFYAIPEDLRKDPMVQIVYVKSLVKAKLNFLDIQNTLNYTFRESPKVLSKLLEFLADYILTVEGFFTSDFEKILSQMEQYNTALFLKLEQKRVFEKSGKKLMLGKEFLQKLVLAFMDFNHPEKNQDIHRKGFILDFFETWLGDSVDTNDEYIRVLLDVIDDIFRTELLKKSVKKSLKESMESAQERTGEESEDIPEPSVENTAEFTLPYQSYVYTAGSGLDITLPGDTKLSISEAEFETMTTRAIENYIEFYTMLYELGIHFMIDKYAQQTKILMDMDFFAGEGMSEGKRLKFLNKLGKNIGIPEKKTGVIKENGEEKVRIECFETLSEAKHQFREIKSTGKINGELVCEPGSVPGKGVVEVYLITEGYIDVQGRGLNLSKWK